MAKVLQHRRGTTAENDAFTGAVGELTVDTDLHRLRLHDGQKQGGYEVGTVQTVNEQLPDDNGNVNISGVPVGTIIWSAVPNAPHGFLVCDGSIVGRATYPELFAAIGTTYGAGDGSSTFNLPNLVGKVAWGSLTVGTEKEAGLPNIEGGFNMRVSDNDMRLIRETYGSIIENDRTSTTITGSGNGSNTRTLQTISFDASISSSIYGNSSTVQPPALTLLPCIKAYESVVDDGTVVVSELARDVERIAQDAARKEEVVESGDGFIRYASGLQMCWGYDTVTLSTDNGSGTVTKEGALRRWQGNKIITFPVAFVSLQSCVANVDSSAGYWNCTCGELALTSAKIHIAGDKNASKTCNWIAIGHWK